MPRLLPVLAAWLLTAGLAAASPDFWQREWPETDFSETSVESWSEILSGGPPKDGIPALSDPDFVRVSDKTGLEPREPVITVEIDGAEPRAYPIRYLTWHEIVNDTVGGVPVAVTFCPLCNSGLTFDRRRRTDRFHGYRIRGAPVTSLRGFITPCPNEHHHRQARSHRDWIAGKCAVCMSHAAVLLSLQCLHCCRR